MFSPGPSLSDYMPDGSVAPSAPVPAGPPAAPEHLQARPAPEMPVAPQQLPAAPGPAAASRSAGLSLIGAAVATGVGGWFGGGFGAGAGLLLFGGVRNALRARSAWVSSPPDATVATRSATLALFGLCAGGYLGYRAYVRKTDG